MSIDHSVAPHRPAPSATAERTRVLTWRPARREHEGLRLDVPTSARLPLPRRRRGDDLLTVAGDVTVACVVSVGLLGRPTAPGEALLSHVALALAWVALLHGARCYGLGPLTGGTGSARRILQASVALVALLSVLPGVLPGVVPSLLAAPLEPATTVLVSMLLAGGALAHRSGRSLARRGQVGTRNRPLRTVVAGHGRDVARVVAELARDRRHELSVSAVCVPAASGTHFDVPTARGFPLLAETVRERRAEVVVVLPCHHFDPVTLRRLGWQLESEGAHLVVASGLFDVDRSRARVLRAGGLELVHVRHAELTGVRRLVKQLWERPAAAVTLLLLAPLLAALAVAIRLESPGPALFRQVRIGKDGEPFVMVKLRTMSESAESLLPRLTNDHDRAGVLFKMRADPRVTRLGRVLRRYSLDELPQLVNVVRGEMSLVGPRPALSSEAVSYDGDTVRRLAVRPGMTGLWQVSGRSDLTWAETVRLDLRYVENWSLTLDAVIVLRTLRAVVGHRGAY